MGRPRKPKSETPQPTPPKHGNGFDPAKVQQAVSRIESLHGDIAKIMMAALTECKAVHGDMKEVYQEAKDESGIPKKELKRVIKARALERKAAEIRENLEAEEQDNYDLIRHALGDLADTPLGQAATKGSIDFRKGERKTFGEQMREPGAPLDPSTADPPFAAPPPV